CARYGVVSAIRRDFRFDVW
nr:immunoglobulin heavy chain junction region [Macaca mulatta]